MGEEGAWGVDTSTKTLFLREVQEDDLSMLMEHRNQWETRRWLENAREVTMEGQRIWFGMSSRSVRIVMEGETPIGLARIACEGPGHYSVGCDVFAEHRGRGLGRPTFDAACNRAIQLGATTLSLWVFVDNLPAVTIYKHAGFDWDHSAAIKIFRRPEKEFGPVKDWIYARMTRTA